MFAPRFSLGLACFISLVTGPFAHALNPWHALAPGLEQARVSTPSSGLFSSELLLFRAQLDQFRAETLRAKDFGEPRMPVSRLCPTSKAVLCINAHFFDETGNPLGLLIHRGITVQPMHQGGRTLSGVFSVTRESVQISSRSEFKAERVLEAIQSGPRLLQSRNPVPGVEVSSRSRRSGVCIDGQKRLIVYIVASGLLGLTLPELQNSLRAPDIDCVDALNFDGGGSSQLFLSGQIPDSSSNLQQISIPGRDEVPVALALYPKNSSF